MSNSDFTRRDLLRTIGSSMVLTTAGAGVLTPALAQHVHQALLEEKSLNPGGNYQPKYLKDHEYKTLRRLAELIVPADESTSSALDAGAPEFIDFLCSRNTDLAEIFTGGLAWMNDEMRRRYKAGFVDATPQQQTELLDLIAYRKNDSPALAPGIRFFVWARNMVVDAYYASPAGVKDLGFMGNAVLSQFSVPKEALDYALKRSPFGAEG